MGAAWVDSAKVLIRENGAGVDLKVVQETLGHSLITLTSDSYTSVYPAVAPSAADAAAALVARAVGTEVVTRPHVRVRTSRGSR